MMFINECEWGNTQNRYPKIKAGERLLDSLELKQTEKSKSKIKNQNNHRKGASANKVMSINEQISNRKIKIGKEKKKNINFLFSFLFLIFLFSTGFNTIYRLLAITFNHFHGEDRIPPFKGFFFPATPDTQTRSV
jgi:hypothetical protein